MTTLTTTKTVAVAVLQHKTPARPVNVQLKLNTPGLLRLMLGATLAATVLFLVAAGVGVERHRHAVQAIGRDAAPSIIAAQSLRASFAWAQADAARTLHGEPDAAAAYDAHRRAAADQLVAAAENITYGDAERQPIERMVDAFGRYGADVARARTLTGAASTAALVDADRLLHDHLLVDADALDGANRDALEQAYATERSDAAWSLGWTVVAGVALLAALVGTQLFLTRRTRRWLNPPLATASVLTAGLLLWLVVAMASSAGHLRAAKADAFDSVSALLQARAVAVDDYAARLGGTDPRRPGDDDARLASPPAGMSFDDAVAACQGTTVPPGMTGLLADELRNLTYPGEREAAVEAMRSFADFRSRGDAASFATFDAALGRTLEINRTAFDATVTDGLGAVDGLTTASAVAAAVVALAAWVGLRPRLREYVA